MTQCQRCHARATRFLCTNCTNELREMLTGLARGQRLPSGHVGAGWLENLEDVVLKRTRTGESVRRSTDRTGPLMVHLESSRLLDNVHATLVRWVQDICDSRGIDYRPPGTYPMDFIGPLPLGTVRAERWAPMFPRDFIGPLPLGAVRGHATNATRSAAVWLAKNVNAIACDEAAGLCYGEIKHVIDEIERMINRPENVVECGPCPTINADQTECAVGLRAKRGDAEVSCWKCKQTHNVKHLIEQALEDCKRWLWSESEILDIMAQIGEQIPRGTWWNWRTRGLIESRNEWDAEPRFWLEDARLLWRSRVGTRKRTELVG